ncbi:MAG: hypothetical protein AB7O68_20000 [Pirellulales bacterium]
MQENIERIDGLIRKMFDPGLSLTDRHAVEVELRSASQADVPYQTLARLPLAWSFSDLEKRRLS